MHKTFLANLGQIGWQCNVHEDGTMRQGVRRQFGNGTSTLGQIDPRQGTLVVHGRPRRPEILHGTIRRIGGGSSFGTKRRRIIVGGSVLVVVLLLLFMWLWICLQWLVRGGTCRCCFGSTG